MDNQQPTGGESTSATDVSISQERRMVALECTWEIEVLNDRLRDLGEGLVGANISHEELARMWLAIRGATARLEDLNSVVMSVLDEDDDIGNLSQRVRGARAAAAGGTCNAH
jgi:hypothetical protein